MVVVVMLIVVVDVDVYMMFQQSHVIEPDPKKKNPQFLYISLNKIFYLQRYNVSTINNIYV